MEEKDNSRIYKTEEKTVNIKFPWMFQRKTFARREILVYNHQFFIKFLNITAEPSLGGMAIRNI